MGGAKHKFHQIQVIKVDTVPPLCPLWHLLIDQKGLTLLSKKTPKDT